MTTICLGIIHAAHVPERKELLSRLTYSLTPTPREVIAHRVHCERESPRQWARRSWRWALETGADFSIIVNDDVVLAPQFWAAIGAILCTFPKRTVLGLATVSAGQRDAYARDEHWLRDGHGVVGWAVGMWREEIALLVGAEAELPPDHRSPHSHDECRPDCPHWHEDSWTNELLAKYQIPVWHPVPSIVDHDTSLPSLYGNDHHKARRPLVTWRRYDLTSSDYWRT